MIFFCLLSQSSSEVGRFGTRQAELDQLQVTRGFEPPFSSPVSDRSELSASKRAELPAEFCPDKFVARTGANHLTTNHLLLFQLNIFQARAEACRFQDMCFRFINCESTVSVGGDSRLIIMATGPDGWLHLQSPAGPGSGQLNPYDGSNACSDT